ncbi:hypothetical protein ACJMK2_034946 [Sinanodonta woodiana]|uniref:Poly(A)-specific ribonuclease PARN n=1 Tax=Sinanodonta woodiana TaxID=1069815 RepID=A0ABD3WT92_SINWO
MRLARDMEVTRKNFEESLEIVTKAIEEASFITIDGEFTGLNVSGSSHTGPLDTPEERYHKLLEGSTDFLLIQVGICAFIYDGSAKRYTAKPFNFYVFPRPYTRHAPDRRFLCQCSSLDFLVSQGFDFNKLFREGISYLSPPEEKRMREDIEQRHQQHQMSFYSPGLTSPDGGEQTVPKGPIAIPEEHSEFINNICCKVEDFLTNSEDETLELMPCTAFQRKLLYQTLGTKFPQEIHLQSKSGEKNQRFLVVTRVKGEGDIKKKEDQKQQEDFAELDRAVGFTKVMKVISQSGKLVVGHNMLLDLIHLLGHFFYPLPESYEEFKLMARCIFPRLLDTKLMANTQPFKEKILMSGLSDLKKTVEQEPFCKSDVVIPEGFGHHYMETEQLHEAAYDAFITGLCFISMANYLGKFQDPPAGILPPASPLLEPFVNKLFMMRLIDIPYMDLTGPDLKPTRDHVFHVTFPATWRTSDLFQLFSPFGNIHITWLDDVSSFVSLAKKEAADSVLKTLCKKGTPYRITTYDEFKRRGKEKNGRLTSSGHSVSKKRPSSSEDVDIPSKKQKQKSLNVNAAPFQSKLTPTNTPEKADPESAAREEESMSTAEEEQGKGDTGTSSEVDKAEKMFEVPETWE